MEKVSKISIIILIIFMINNVTYLSIDYLDIIYKNIVVVQQEEYIYS